MSGNYTDVTESPDYQEGYKDGVEEEKERLLIIILTYAGVLRQQGKDDQADLVLRVHKFLEDERVKELIKD
jgi:hypothetical protein